MPLWSLWMIRQKIDYIHANPVKAHLSPSARDYEWTSFRAFYLGVNEPLPVERHWWWPEDQEKFLRAVKRVGVGSCRSGGKPLFLTCYPGLLLVAATLGHQRHLEHVTHTDDNPAVASVRAPLVEEVTRNNRRVGDTEISRVGEIEEVSAKL